MTFSQNSYVFSQCGGYRPFLKVLFVKTIEINSQSETFNVDLAQDLGITQNDNGYIQVSVVFTEEVTGKYVTADASIDIVQYSFEVLFSDNLNTNNYYTANSTIQLKISVRKTDGTLVRVWLSKYQTDFNQRLKFYLGTSRYKRVSNYWRDLLYPIL